MKPNIKQLTITITRITLITQPASLPPVSAGGYQVYIDNDDDDDDDNILDIPTIPDDMIQVRRCCHLLVIVSTTIN